MHIALALWSYHILNYHQIAFSLYFLCALYLNIRIAVQVLDNTSFVKKETAEGFLLCPSLFFILFYFSFSLC